MIGVVKNNKKLQRGSKLLLKVTGILVFSFFLLHLGLYYGSDWLLRGFLQRQVEKVSEGKYTVDFGRFYLSIFERGFYIKDFYLSPVDETVFGVGEKPFYQISVPEISLKRLSFSRRDKTIAIGELRLKGPYIQSRQEQDVLEQEDLSPLQLLESEIQKSLGGDIEEVIIHNFYVEEADLLMENFISQKSIKASHTNLYVKDLGVAREKAHDLPFNAEGFTLHLSDFEILLADSIHRVSATSVDISSLDKHIMADQVRISPDFSRETDAYYEISLDNLNVDDADILQMFQTSNVVVGDLNLIGPDFTLYTERTVADGEERTTDLYELIRDVLASISVNTLNISKGKYLQRGVHDANKNRIEAAEINFLMDQVYIGPEESRRRDLFFYAKDAELEIYGARIALADGIHWITGEKVFLSSFKDHVSMTNVEMLPRFDEDDLPDATLFEIEVPKLDFANANLRKIYNENIVDIEEMTIHSPDVLLKDIRGGTENALSGNTLQELTKDFLKAIYIKKLEMSEGSLTLDNHLRIRQDSLSFGKISFTLENFQLDEERTRDEKSRIFFADELRLDIENYALKLSDNLHLFSADRIFIDTKQELLNIEGFRLQPFSTGDIQPILERYGRTTVLDIEIPYFSAIGVDINQAFFEEKLFVKHIDIPSPVIHWKKYIQKEDKEEEEIKIERGDILNLITNYFSVIGVDALTVNEGTFIYDNFANERFRSFAENDVAVSIKGFYLDENSDPLDNRTLFSEEVDINLDNYVFNIADGQYNVVAERISFNSAREEINTFNVRLRPNRFLDKKVSIQAAVPDMSIKGVDLEAFLFENTLSLTNLKLSDANVQLSINRDAGEEEETAGSGGRRRERSLPKTIDIVRIDSILAENARFGISYFLDGNDVQLITTGINMSFSGFMLDSARLTEGDIAGFFDHMSLEADDFTLALKDSIHTINFSKIELDSKSDEIVLENLTIQPNNLNGQLGIPIVQARIPRAIINTRSLIGLQKTGEIDIRRMVLTDPDVTIYLDKSEVATLRGEEEDEKAIQRILEHLRIKNFEISGGRLAIKEKNDISEVSAFENLSIILNDLNFDLTRQQKFDSQFLLNSDYAFELKDYEIDLPDSLNRLRIGLALLSKDRLELQDVTYLPKVGRYQYVRGVGMETDVAEVYVPKVIFTGVDVEKFINENKLRAGTMLVLTPDIEIFRDKRMPPNSDTTKLMPQQLMVASEIFMDLDTLMIRDGTFFYREFPERGMVPGEIRFSRLNAKMFPFRLTQGNLQQREKANISGSFLINDKALLALDASMDFDPPYPVKVEATVGEFELSLINSILESNAFVSVERGTIQGGEWHFIADAESAQGSMTLRYNNLKVRLLDERTLERARGRKGILTFVINALAMRKNNPRKIFNRLVSSPIYEPRDPSKFVFNYMWKATFSGLMGSSGLLQPKIPRKEEEEKQRR
ncbi:hypothetical protein [Negadavirga shengliensis]|uniref:DUF748 domain-containing protein n=1 Tax=Negadavirga shengliensis TaxID=1389218 RepID=A0ABV9SVW6_9BACT